MDIETLKKKMDDQSYVYDDTLATVLAVALQLGRPIIGSQIGGIPELVDGNGMTFPHGDVEALEKCLTEFPEPGTATYEVLCNNSRELFAKNYMAAGHYEKLLPVYEVLVKKN